MQGESAPPCSRLPLASRLCFGLGNATEVDRVEVLWPSGSRQTIERPPLDARLVVTEPEQADGEPTDDAPAPGSGR